MEFLNKIEITGIVGRADSKPDPNGEGKQINFSVVTQHASRDRSDNVVVDCLWLLCQYHAPGDLELAKGDWVHLEGRLAQRRYVNSDGNDQATVTVVVKSLTKLTREV